MAEDEVCLARRRGAELAGRDLAIGPADADLEGADQQRAGTGLGMPTVAVLVEPSRSGVVISACIRSHVMFADMPLVVTWLGQAGFRLETGGGGIRILVDPFFAEYEARLYPPPSVDEFGTGVDWLLVTHEHIDHLDPYSLREVAARSDELRIVAPAPLEAMVREAAPDVCRIGVDRGDRIEFDGVGAARSSRRSTGSLSPTRTVTTRGSSATCSSSRG